MDTEIHEVNLICTTFFFLYVPLSVIVHISMCAISRAADAGSRVSTCPIAVNLSIVIDQQKPRRFK